MIDLVLIEKIWDQTDLAPLYLAEIKQICLSTGSSTSFGALDQLPLLFCQLNGGEQQQVVPVITAWTLLRYAARLLDDIEDGDLKRQHVSQPIALNVSTGILFSVGLILNELESVGVTSEGAGDIRQKFYQDLLQICSGQHLDLSCTTPTLEEAWQIAGTKSGVFVGLICWAGGRVADAELEQLELYQQFGYNLGLLDQMKDDLADLWSNETHFSDLGNGRNHSLPSAYALSVLPEKQRQKLLIYLNNSNNIVDAEENARELIVQSGAGVYLTVQSTYYYQQNQQLLEKMNLPSTVQIQLNTLLDKIRISTINA